MAGRTWSWLRSGETHSLFAPRAFVFDQFENLEPKNGRRSGGHRRAVYCISIILHNLLIRWFLSSQFTHKPVNLIVLFLDMELS